MRVHPVTGQVAHGIAGEGVYIDGGQVAPGGGRNGMPDWVGDGIRWAGADGEADAGFVRGSQVGVWAKWNPAIGVRRSDGFALPEAVLLDMAPDGTMLVGDNYQSGIGLSAYKAGSTQPAWRIPTARPELRFPDSEASILDAQTACWTENVNGRMVLRGYFSGSVTIGPRPPWSVLHPVLKRVNGEPWVLYLRNEDDYVLAHPWDYRGLGFVKPGGGFGIEARVQGSTFTVLWSTGAGELPEDIQRRPFDLTALEEIPSVAQKVLPPDVASVQLAGTWLADATAPGNAAIGSPTYTLPKHACVIAEAKFFDLIPEERRAGLLVYLDSDDQSARDTIARSIPIAARYRVPMFIYDDRRVGRFGLVDEACRGAPWVWMPQWYLNVGEDPEDFAAAILLIARAYVGQVPIWPVIRAYTALRRDEATGTLYDAISERDVVAGLNALIEARALQLEGLLGWEFFAFDRADGIKFRPLVAAAIAVWMNVPTSEVNGRAFADLFFDDTPVPAPLEVTITDYTKIGTAPMTVVVHCQATGTLRAGAEVHALVNGQSQAWGMVPPNGLAVLRFTLTEPGEYSLRARIVDGDRKAETGAIRLIRVNAPPEIPGITYPTQPGSGTVEGARTPLQEAAEAAKREEG
jgi:hypothetical protein